MISFLRACAETLHCFPHTPGMSRKVMGLRNLCGTYLNETNDFVLSWLREKNIHTIIH